MKMKCNLPDKEKDKSINCGDCMHRENHEANHNCEYNCCFHAGTKCEVVNE